MNEACVITTVNPPTKTVEMLSGKFPNIYVIGDRKTPGDWSYPGTRFSSFDSQVSLAVEIFKGTLCSSTAAAMPENHYARKNIGYLFAIRDRATLIYDTDDDNYPVAGWKVREQTCEATSISCEGWCNVYQRLHNGLIWPRGMALEHIASIGTIGQSHVVTSPIQQGLANGNTDVDAIWRLAMQRDVTFSSQISFSLAPGTWCPFNSQTTWWWPAAYQLMYLPIYSTFRMCDIWRSFVAQRCLWAEGKTVVFHSPGEVFQDRNPHNLLADFKDEVPGYLHNGEIAKVLGALSLNPDRQDNNQFLCYAALVDAGFLPKEELEALLMWQYDFKEITK